MQRSEDGRWETEFGKFVVRFGIRKLAKRIRVDPSAIGHWVAGRNAIRMSTAKTIQKIAKDRGVSLSLDEIFCRIQPEPYKTAAPQRSPQHARA